MPQDVDPGAVKQIQRCLGLDGPQVEIEIRGLGLAVALPESDQVWRDNVEIRASSSRTSRQLPSVDAPGPEP